MQIGEVAGRVGLSLRTIRHWGELGLAAPSGRSPGGFRLYTQADVERLMLLKTLKPLDFSITQLRELLAVMDAVAADTGDDPETTRQLLGRLEMFRAATDARIDALRAQVGGLGMLSRELRSLSARAQGRNAESGR